MMTKLPTELESYEWNKLQKIPSKHLTKKQKERMKYLEPKIKKLVEKYSD